MSKEKISRIKVSTVKQIVPEAHKELIHDSPKVKVINKLEMYSNTYPEFDIKQFDLCANLEEEVSVYVNIGFTIKKKDVIKLVQIAASDFELSGDERLPVKITIETMFEDIKKEEEKYRKKLVLLEHSDDNKHSVGGLIKNEFSRSIK